MRMPSLAWINLEWRWSTFFYVLIAVEVPFTVAALALYGIADPDLYRTQLWQEGANQGWNSDPIEILYSYANYRPIATPTPWNQSITTYNVIIAVLSMFIMLVKTVMFITATFPPLASAVVHATIAALYAVSIDQQAASDYSDPLHPSKFPWYLTRSCNAPVNPNLHGYCQQAQASFAVAVCICALFTLHTVVAIICCFRTKEQKAALKSADIESPYSTFDDKKWEMEMGHWPKTPGITGGMKTPMTPRTMAFNTLDGTLGSRRPNRDLPLRHHIAMGKDTYSGR
ncbi:hypothetical protein MMC19_003219 [Ptychographa xylographoides]|nr:hypothetical protein [Ptychographa xylographoides]